MYTGILSACWMPIIGVLCIGQLVAQIQVKELYQSHEPIVIDSGYHESSGTASFSWDIEGLEVTQYRKAGEPSGSVLHVWAEPRTDPYRVWMQVVVRESLLVVVGQNTDGTLKTQERLLITDFRTERASFRVGVSDPPMPPDKPTTMTLRKLSEAEARKVNDVETAQKLAIGYAVILANQYDTTSQFVADMGRIADSVIESDRKDAWQPWRDKLSDKLVLMAQLGELRTIAAYKSALEEIIRGLNDSTGGAFAKAVDFELILDVVRLVIDVVRGNFELLDVVQRVITILERLIGQSITSFEAYPRGLYVDGENHSKVWATDCTKALDAIRNSFPVGETFRGYWVNGRKYNYLYAVK